MSIENKVQQIMDDATRRSEETHREEGARILIAGLVDAVTEIAREIDQAGQRQQRSRFGQLFKREA